MIFAASRDNGSRASPVPAAMMRIPGDRRWWTRGGVELRHGSDRSNARATPSGSEQRVRMVGLSSNGRKQEGDNGVMASEWPYPAKGVAAFAFLLPPPRSRECQSGRPFRVSRVLGCCVVIGLQRAQRICVLGASR